MAERPTLKQFTEWVNFERRDELLAADLTGMVMTGAELWGGNLSGLNFRDCDFAGSNLFGSDMSDADLRGASLVGADLHRTNLRGAIYDDDTRFPAEFSTEERHMVHGRDLPDAESDN
ncbi:pentapeptide repeat-containing protein [Candidatus Poribacteria bacterium]|jgi:uncharacterized protein YjbI with pentapeptide repeats|nr:pentapeptide repeat-containing protein [Candidatus Poribacteria bacterium]MBT5532529.1 pentapeptide repeat-containing protein [Candidatus Poribacteria bacterium]MBT5714488.1 pentapeptide repeat-containing protein [Candidatus Poribacteria bacterium]MBT7096321.1 pentapeptide repeat-containing protein [Candidatus Poribacteria bacterium]MBT7808650.1 pentapeptide repeat-containing protein [Candidatus Poribacteria bacterium]